MPNAMDHGRRKLITQILALSIVGLTALLPAAPARSALPLALTLRLVITSLKKSIVKGARQAKGFATGVSIEQAGAFLVSQHGWEYAAKGLAGISAYAVSHEVAASIELYGARAVLVQRNVENPLAILVHNPSESRVKDYILVTLEDLHTGDTDWYCPDTLLIELEPHGFMLQELTITNILSPGVKRIRAESVDGILVTPESDNIVVASENKLLIGE